MSVTERANYLLSREGAIDNLLVMTYAGVELRCYDFNQLRPAGWLTSDLMEVGTALEYHTNILNRCKGLMVPKVLCVSHRTMDKGLKLNRLWLQEFNYNECHRYIKWFNLYNFDTVCFPIFIEHGHWVLVKVDNRTWVAPTDAAALGTITFLDSFCDRRGRAGRGLTDSSRTYQYADLLLRNIQQFMNLHADDRKVQRREWLLVREGCCVQQPNDNDCGVATLLTMRAIALGRNESEIQAGELEDFRAVLVQDILGARTLSPEEAQLDREATSVAKPVISKKKVVEVVDSDGEPYVGPKVINGCAAETRDEDESEDGSGEEMEPSKPAQEIVGDVAVAELAIAELEYRELVEMSNTWHDLPVSKLAGLCEECGIDWESTVMNRSRKAEYVLALRGFHKIEEAKGRVDKRVREAARGGDGNCAFGEAAHHRAGT